MNIAKKLYACLVGAILFTFLLPTNLLAQCPAQPVNSVAGNFDLQFQGVDIQTICVGSLVSIQEKSGGTNLQYWFELNSNTLPTTGGTTSTTWTYTKPGTYCVLQQGDKGGKKLFAVTTLKVISPSPISLQVANCSKGIVKLTVNKDANEADPFSHYGSYTINWGDGNTITEVKNWSGEHTFTHNYTSDSKKTIVVSGHIQDVAGVGCGGVATTEVLPIVTELYQPEITKLEMQASGGGEMIFLQQKGGYYDLLRQDASGGYVSTGVKGQCDNNDPKGYLMPSIDITKTTCFKVLMSDQCNNIFPSQEICSIPLSASQNTGKIALKWTQYPNPTPFKKYGLLKDGNTFYPINFDIGKLGLISFNQTEDTDYGCGSQVCYQVNAIISQNVQLPLSMGGGVKGTTMLSSSNISCVQPTTIPAQMALTNIFTSVENNKIVVIPSLPNNLIQKGFNLYRKSYNESDFSLIQTTTSKTSFLDEAVNPSAGKNCYKVSYISACGTESLLSDEFCPIFLQSQGAYASWTDYVKFLNGISSYYLEKLDENKTILSFANVGTALGWQVDDDDNMQDVLLRVRGLSQDNLTTYSNVVSITRPPRMYMPDVFTPNDDMVNDNLVMKGLFIKSMKMSIFDRWGNEVFTTQDIDVGWDGTIKGQLAQEGTYAYKLNVIDMKGVAFEKEGTVMLMR